MTKDYPGEQWKTVQFDFEYSNDFRLDVSNYGRLRTFNKVADGNLINGSMVNGYRIIRLKLYKARAENVQQQLDYLQQQVIKLNAELKQLRKSNKDSKAIADTESMVATLKKNLSAKFKKDLKERTIFYQSLIHRLVATYFLPPAQDGQTVIAHLDYNKMNNRVTNLKWMTPEENYAHQQHSPNVIREKQQRKFREPANSKAVKLTVTKVMLLKKLFNQGKPMKQLVKQFKVTETQLYRIKRGENWANIEATK